MATLKVEAWRHKHEEGLRCFFADFSEETGIEQSESNFDLFVHDMYKECRHILW